MDEVSVLDKLKEVSKYINENTDEINTILEISKTDNPDIKKLSLKSGSWSGKEPWYVIDEDQKLHTMISIDSIHKLIDNFKKLQQENFNLKLEKTILQNIPIDFQDVWIVAMDEIKNMANESSELKSLNIDLEKLLKKIKKEHPNLFLNLKDMFLQNDIQQIG